MSVRNYSHVYCVKIISNTRFSNVANDVFNGGNLWGHPLLCYA